MNYISAITKHLFETVNKALPYVFPLTLLVFIIGIQRIRNKKNIIFNLKFLLLSFITSLIIYITLISRFSLNITNPLAIFFKGWSLFERNSNGSIRLDFIAIENTFMLLPFTFMFLETFNDKYSKLSFKELMLKGFKVSLSFTLTIEISQLLLRLGTTQISDVIYNTIGGCFGALLFYLIRHKENTID